MHARSLEFLFEPFPKSCANSKSKGTLLESYLVGGWKVNDETIELKDDGFKNLMKAFAARMPVARVGILGDNTRKPVEGEKKATSNAEIGVAHEFGTEHMARRSWLRQPLNDHLNKALETAGAFDDATLKRVINDRSILPWVKLLGVTAESVIAEGFASNGYGKWDALKPGPYADKKKNNQILVESTQLRDSVTSDAK